MSDFKIIGNPDPVVGKEEFYSVNDFLPNVLPFQHSASNANNHFEQPVKWEVYVLENGRWRKTKENDKTGKKISYTFFQRSLDRKGIRILAKRGDEEARLNIKSHPAEAPKIESIELLDKNGKKPEKPLSYGQTLKARVHCLHMEKRKINVTLWEDDADGGGHDKANTKNILQILPGIVKNGKADVNFLLRPSFAKTAKKSKDEGKVHEYYVTTDFNNGKIASNNVDVNDLEVPVAPYKRKIPVQQPAQPKTAVQKPVQEKANTSGSSAQVPKAKAEITNVHLTDTAGHKIQGAFKEKQIKVWIDSNGLIGKEIRLKLYDEDGISDDELFNDKFIIRSNIYSVVIPLNKIPRSKGGNYWGEGAEQEVYADVEVIQTKQTKPSKIVNVDATVFKPDPIEVTNKVAKIFTPEKKDKKEEKGTCVCKENNFYWSDKLTCDERKKVLQVCSNLWGEDKKKEKASELMAIMHLETGSTFKPSADNGAGFSGLIQFSDAAAKGLGTTRAKLKAMTFIDQMAFVEDYFKKKKDQLKTMVDLYLLVLKPNAVGNGSNPKYVLFDESIDVPDGDGSKTSPEQRAVNIGQEPWVTKYGYSSNPSFMKEENERTKREKWVYTRQKKEQRWGFNNGKTTVSEVIEELTEKHYKPGAIALFKGSCENLKSEDKSQDKERSPWMKIALEEAKTYGGKDESDIDSRIKTYHSDGGGSPGSGSGTAWCASFVCWCLEESGNKSPKSAGSRMFLDSKKVEKCEVFYGAVAIFSDCDSTGKKMQTSGHATFVFGELPVDDIYACLGGNQGDMLKISKYDCSGNVFVSYTTKKGVKHYKIFRGFYKPMGYEIRDIDKLNKDDKYTSADEASKKVLKLNIKSNESGESSR